MKQGIVLLLGVSSLMASESIPAAPQMRGAVVQKFTQEPEFPHQLHNAFRADALTDPMVDYFLKNSSQKQRARRLEQIADMAPEIFAVAERLMSSDATKVQIQNALAGLRLLDFLEGEQDYVSMVARAELLAKSLQVKIPAKLQ